jgi:hypothetical protein
MKRLQNIGFIDAVIKQYENLPNNIQISGFEAMIPIGGNAIILNSRWAKHKFSHSQITVMNRNQMQSKVNKSRQTSKGEPTNEIHYQKAKQTRSQTFGFENSKAEATSCSRRIKPCF